jgi:hypothetical protein
MVIPMLKMVSKQRQLSADLSAEDQIANLSSLIKNPPQNSRVIEVSPELASYILENLNIGNRSKKVDKIKVYANDMANGNWSLTNATLAFGSDGFLKDGQNRLSACVRAGKPFKTHSIFGIEPQSFIHMDVGANRTHMDVFTIMGTPYPSVTGAVIRHIVAFKKQQASTKNVRMTNDDLRNYYNNEIDSLTLELSIKLAKITKKNTLIPVPPLAALFYIVSVNGDLEKAKSFLNDLAANYGKGVRAPVRKLLHTLTEIRVANRNKVMPDVMSILLARTWVNYKEGRASTKADMAIGADAGMPKL